MPKTLTLEKRQQRVSTQVRKGEAASADAALVSPTDGA
jgi:hypothetical protein